MTGPEAAERLADARAAVSAAVPRTSELARAAPVLLAEVERLAGELDRLARSHGDCEGTYTEAVAGLVTVSQYAGELAAERDEQGRRAGRLAADAQCGEAVGERESVEAGLAAERGRRLRAEATLERVRAVSVMYADAVRGLSQNGSDRDAVRARHYRQFLRDLDAALAPADAGPASGVAGSEPGSNETAAPVGGLEPPYERRVTFHPGSDETWDATDQLADGSGEGSGS